MSTKPRARLENWYLIPWANQLTGIVSGHPRAVPGGELDDGRTIFTSTVINLDREKKEAETLNTIYELGEEWLSKSMMP